MKKIILLMLVALSISQVQAYDYDIKDNKGYKQFSIEGGAIKDRKGYSHGKIKKDGTIVNRKGYKVGKIDKRRK